MGSGFRVAGLSAVFVAEWRVQSSAFALVG